MTAKNEVAKVAKVETFELPTLTEEVREAMEEELDGMNLGAVHARVITAGTTGTTDIQVRNVTGTADMLSTVITIDSGDTGSDTATAAAVIDAANDDVSTNDLIAIDVDAVSTTAPKGLIVRLRFVPA